MAMMDKIERLAGRFRVKYQLNDLKVSLDLERLLEKMDILLFKKPLSEGISGGFFKVDLERVILVNTTKTIGRQNFSIAHELYHAEYSLDMKSVLCNTGSSLDTSGNEEEKKADMFASALLMPREGIDRNIAEIQKEELETVKPETVVWLENIYKVSHLAMCWRLHNLDYIDRITRETYAGVKVTQIAEKMNLSTDIYRNTNETKISDKFLILLDTLRRYNRITTQKYSEVFQQVGCFRDCEDFPQNDEDD
ncbi:MAG: ImmA/IrrE family metallo-endopeptidase [Thermovirgaceae bacterium]|nr:ImmA/IrrE family metallo-endopeptidase [Thermovirgaceae bacterium]